MHQPENGYLQKLPACHFDVGANLKLMKFTDWWQRFTDLDGTHAVLLAVLRVEPCRHILAHPTPSIVLLSIDLFREKPVESLGLIAYRIGMENRARQPAPIE